MQINKTNNSPNLPVCLKKVKGPIRVFIFLQTNKAFLLFGVTDTTHV